jgi:hypothetical protein
MYIIILYTYLYAEIIIIDSPNTGVFEVMWPGDARAILADRKQNALGTRLII